MKKRVLIVGSVLAMVGGAFVAGSLWSVCAPERQFPSPLDRTQADLAEAQILLEQADRGDLEKVRGHLRLKMDSLVLALDTLARNTSDPHRRERAGHLLHRVARHREVYAADGGEETLGRVQDVQVAEILGQYRDLAH